MAPNDQISIFRRFVELCIPYKGIKRRQKGVSQYGHVDKTVLRRALPGWQILLIAIGGVIGITIFSTHGELIRIAGPGGLLVATLFVATTMICVMECLGEMVIQWPVSNAMVEYVRTFVDEDLAIVVGIAYWYSFSCVFATLVCSAADFAKYNIASGVGRGVLFYVIIPVCMVIVNVLGVEYYGFVEGIAGIIKLLMVISGIFLMIAKAPSVGSQYLDDGFQYQDKVARSRFEAIWSETTAPLPRWLLTVASVVIPLLSYGYIGTEIVSVTAFEALDRKDLRLPARGVSYIIALLYFVSALLQCFLVKYNNPWLQNIIPDANPQGLQKREDSKALEWYPVVVIAARQYVSDDAGRYFIACIIFFCISASNTALYVASRTLFGLTRNLNRGGHVPLLLKPFSYFGTTSPTRQVPLFALVFSAVAFYWLVPLKLTRGFETSDMLAIMSTTASIGAVLVWASQCLAFIRYYLWLRKFRDAGTLPAKYNRWDPKPDLYTEHKHRMLLSDFRLVPAFCGLIGCLLIVFVFSSANWWVDGHVTLTRGATAYTGPIVLAVLFLLLKARNRRGWVKLSADNETFARIMNDLERTSNLRSGEDGAGEGDEIHKVGVATTVVAASSDDGRT